MTAGISALRSPARLSVAHLVLPRRTYSIIWSRASVASPDIRSVYISHSWGGSIQIRDCPSPGPASDRFVVACAHVYGSPPSKRHVRRYFRCLEFFEIYSSFLVDGVERSLCGARVRGARKADPLYREIIGWSGGESPWRGLTTHEYSQ